MQHLEQEKHELRRRLESREGEWEGRVAELETDVQQLQGELERQQLQLREADRDKTKAVSELSEQNHRLLEQLSRVRSAVLSECLPVWRCLIMSFMYTHANSSDMHALDVLLQASTANLQGRFN